MNDRDQNLIVTLKLRRNQNFNITVDQIKRKMTMASSNVDEQLILPVLALFIFTFIFAILISFFNLFKFYNQYVTLASGFVLDPTVFLSSCSTPISL
jgi:hypothetical protein